MCTIKAHLCFAPGDIYTGYTNMEMANMLFNAVNEAWSDEIIGKDLEDLPDDTPEVWMLQKLKSWDNI